MEDNIRQMLAEIEIDVPLNRHIDDMIEDKIDSDIPSCWSQLKDEIGRAHV